MYYGSTDDTNYELEQLRDFKRRVEEEQDREREQREQERQQREAQYWLSASNWPDALRKNASRFRAEAVDTEKFYQDFPDARRDEPGMDIWWRDSANACERALELWPEVAAEYAEDIRMLQEKIAKLKADIPLEIAKRMREENQGSGWTSVCSSLEQSDPESFVYW